MFSSHPSFRSQLLQFCSLLFVYFFSRKTVRYFTQFLVLCISLPSHTGSVDLLECWSPSWHFGEDFALHMNSELQCPGPETPSPQRPEWSQGSASFLFFPFLPLLGIVCMIPTSYDYKVWFPICVLFSNWWWRKVNF